MKKLNIGNGYKGISYKSNEFGIIIEPTLKCVMCRNIAWFIAEHNQPLCIRCKMNNDEARTKK